MKHTKGFTLIELLIVISIIGILATFSTYSYFNVLKNSRIAKAQAELADIKKALVQLEIDTGQLPGHLSPRPCVQNPEIHLNTCSAGLTCTDGSFPNWNGPYLQEKDVLDYWGRPYFFDPDYRCRSYVKGCETVPNNTWVRAIHTHGEDGVQGYGDGDTRDADNVVLILCR